MFRVVFWFCFVNQRVNSSESEPGFESILSSEPSSSLVYFLSQLGSCGFNPFSESNHESVVIE